MEVSELTVQSNDKNPIQVVLPGGGTLQHIGTAIVKAGHLYLRGNPRFTDCETVAMYAPGQWLSVSLEKLPGLPTCAKFDTAVVDGGRNSNLFPRLPPSNM